MTSSTPPPLPPTSPIASQRRGRIVTVLMLGLSGGVGLVVVALVVLRLCGLVIPFSVPSASMSPAIEPGDHIIMEGATYLGRKPARGDIVVFKSDGLSDPTFRPGETHVKRLVGIPGDQLRLADGILYVNGQPMAFHNRAGDIHYVHFSQARFLANDSQTVTVPEGCYFVLGDRSQYSADSRLWGFLPKTSVRGRATFCYWPIQRMGLIQ
jgi:signal peptidase I